MSKDDNKLDPIEAMVFAEGFENPLKQLLEGSKGGTVAIIEEELIDPSDIDPTRTH